MYVCPVQWAHIQGDQIMLIIFPVVMFGAPLLIVAAVIHMIITEARKS